MQWNLNKKRNLYIVLLSLLLTGSGFLFGCSSLGQTPEFLCSGSQNSPQKLLWGYAVEGMPKAQESITAVEKQTGVEADMIVFFHAWPAPRKQDAAGFPVQACRTIRNQGAVPVLTWEPFYFTDNGEERMIDAESICEGLYDDYIQNFANSVKSWGHPVLIRFGHEMNIRRYHWGTRDKDDFGPKSPEKYRRMYRHVVEIFRRENVNNTYWVFCPNAESVPHPSYEQGAEWNTIEAYYPGNAWVDVLGMDGYNWGTTRTVEDNGWDSQWQSFESIFGEAHHELRELSQRKPLFVFETASVQAGGDRGEWLKDALRTAEEWQLNGICWFQADKENDWRLLKEGNDHVIKYLTRGLNEKKQLKEYSQDDQ